MDPIGFSLENFDAVGQWRTTDEGVKIDPSGVLFNGAKIDGPVAMREMLTAKPEMFAERIDGEADDVRSGPRSPVL